MANREDLAQMAHLMRRAGFGATREELEQYVAKGYDATVEELINPPDDMPAGTRTAQKAIMIKNVNGSSGRR